MAFKVRIMTGMSAMSKKKSNKNASFLKMHPTLLSLYQLVIITGRCHIQKRGLLLYGQPESYKDTFIVS